MDLKYISSLVCAVIIWCFLPNMSVAFSTNHKIIKSNRATLIGIGDTFIWNANLPASYSILSNDILNNGLPGVGFILGTNVVLQQKGIWPTGISIAANGSLLIANGTTRPTETIYYSLCDLQGVCVDVAIRFTAGEEGAFNPGSIKTDNNKICFASSVTVNSNQKADTDGLFDYVYGYKWQISYDNGTTWKYLTDDDSETSPSGNSVTLSSLQAKTYIRREAKRYSLPQIYAYTAAIELTPIKNEITFVDGNSFGVAVNGSITLPPITTTYPSTITIVDDKNNIVTQNQKIDYKTVGVYTYTVKAVNLEATVCPIFSSITVQVYDLKNCAQTTEKISASAESWGTVPLLFIPLGVVSNRPLAIDNDMSTYSTISVGLGAVGLGTTWQNLNFGHSIPKGTMVTIKLGQEYSGLQVAGGITIYAVDENNNPIGPMTAVGDGALLDLLVGDNVFEFKFIPKNSSGVPIDYYGVRVNIGSLLAVANNIKIFGAYYEKAKPVDATCVPKEASVTGAAVPAGYVKPVKLNKFVDDVLWGVEDIGLGVASALASVVYPYLAVDQDLDSYAIFNKAVAALNRQKLTVKLRQIARPGDEIRIIMGGFEVPVLDLSLLSDFRVQRYLGDIKVGVPVKGSEFRILDLNLLALLGNVGNRKALIVSSIGQPFDRIEITYLSTVQVGLLGDYTYIYDVSMIPKLVFDGQNPNDPIAINPICAGEYLKVSKNDVCTEYNISFAYANKDGEGNITSFTDIAASAITKVDETDQFVYYEFKTLYREHNGNLFLKVQTNRQGCAYGDPQYLRVDLKNCRDGIVNPVLKSGGF